MAGEIVLGYDGTDGAKAALDEAAKLAKELGDELVVAFAYHSSPLGGEVKDLHDALIERGQAVTGEAVATAQAAGATARAELVHGHPAPAMVETAERLGARMIVVGSYGESPLKGALIGSTPHRLIQVSTVPVLVVRA